MKDYGRNGFNDPRLISQVRLMVRKLALPVLVGLVWLAPLSTARADFIIDNFTSPAFTSPLGGDVNQPGLGTETIGGARTVSYNQATDTDSTHVITGEVNIQGGVFQFVSRHNLSASVTLIWDGNANQTLAPGNFPAPPNDFGLAADFNANPIVQISVPSVTDPGYAVSLRLYGADATKYKEWDLTASTSTLTSGLLVLDVLTAPPSNSSGTVTLSDVQAITLFLQPLGTSVPTQISLDSMVALDPAPVPEPGTLALLGGISSAALGYRCWRARKARFGRTFEIEKAVSD